MTEQRYRLLSSADLRALPPLRWRIKGVLPDAGIAAVYGPSGCGKSFLALDMAAAIAEGRSWFGHWVEKAPVVYIALEGQAGIRQRVAAWEKYYGRDLPLDMNVVLQPFYLRNEKNVSNLAAVVPPGAVVFIDTLSQSTPGIEENSSKDMGEVREAVKQLQVLTGGLVVLIHHTGKEIDRGMRGHSSLHAALDGAIEVSRNGTYRKWKVAKSKDGRDGEERLFRLEEMPIGEDEDGETITSCVVVEEAGASQVKKKPVPQGENQKLIFRALRPLIEKGEIGKPGAPPMSACIALVDAIDAGAEALICDSDKRASRARDAIQGMIERGVFGCNGEWIWLAA